MRYDKEHKARTRERLLDEAAKTIRLHGPDQLGVSALMARAGLTHGGFYAHFRSRDDLVEQALKASFDQAETRFAQSVEGHSPADGLATYVRFYLSMAHVERRDAGCPIPALSADLTRMDGPGRARFAEGVAALARKMATLLERTGMPQADALPRARSAFAEMVGAVLLARAATDPNEAKAIIAASRSLVLERLGLPAA